MAENIFIIEHLEPEVGEWCLIEYEEISKIVGRENLWFTNVISDEDKLEKLGRVFRESVREMGLNDLCVLDPESEVMLESGDSRKFKYFVFGGILGDYPPRKRTKAELTRHLHNVEMRNIGEEQLSTDNAVFVVNEILKGRSFKDIEFIKDIEIRINKIESTILPFSYPVVGGKPRISAKLIKYLKDKG